MSERCETCRHWHKGYRMQGMKVPAFCNRHFHSQPGDDPACKEYEPQKPRKKRGFVWPKGAREDGR